MTAAVAAAVAAAAIDVPSRRNVAVVIRVAVALE